MKKYIRFWALSIAASLALSAGLLAQEQVDVSIKVKKDGKVIQDTTYQFDDVSEARNAIKLMEVLSGEDEPMENVHYNHTMAHQGSGHARAMVFISEDGETTKIKEFHGDSLIWVSEGESPHAQGKKVIVMKSDDGNTFDIVVDEDGEESDIVKTKEIKVIVSGDKEGNWTVVEGGGRMMENDENVYIFKGDEDVEMEVKVIKKEKKK